jgi:hypothetical protein
MADMQTDARYLELLRDRYQFADWEGDTGSPQGPELRIIPFTGDELPGWTLQRGTRGTGMQNVPMVRGIWVSARGEADRALDVEVFQCSSAAAAREYLLVLLGDMQGPVAGRLPPGSLGDVGFHLGNDSAVAFVRGNLVVRIRNAGRKVGSVAAEAAAIDARIVRGRGAR